ncbi:25-hydroxyvitamin D-1 alpha hydroxylase, mitochondrial [Acipenser ruthenus]|uniref:tRNA (guanine(46)-N(7))-methyltransferase n=1 Tax=Acipenser ruthenus TaxID=7906 RepID=A0A444V3X7_ACIRT|nr:25-hydroxyvitamin D-1 alpha hydroxylase, mitochondrial [Acipenser ruthenus]
MKAIYSNVTELMLAGVDTISSTMSWTLYELSRHPEVQDALYREIQKVLQGNSIPSANEVGRMPLMKAVVKEVLREGEEWQSIRSLLGKHMLRPKEVEAYGDILNSVVTDLLRKLQQQRRKNGLNVVRDIANEFYKFGLEGISSVLFESRIGCLEPSVPKETEEFIQSINTMFVMTLLTMAMPKWLHRIFKKPWHKFCQSWDYMFAFAKGHIDGRMAEVAEKVLRGEAVEGRYLTFYLSRQNLPMKAIYSNVTELMLAGVDTISSTMSWTLYELSRHPEVQDALYREIQKVLQGNPIPSANELEGKAKYGPMWKASFGPILTVHVAEPALIEQGLVYTITDVEEVHEWMVKHFTEHPLYERVPREELADDIIIDRLGACTEEGKKVQRNGGQNFLAIFRRVEDQEQMSSP